MTAREHLRVAAALRDLPLTAAAFAEGRLTFSKVRVIIRIASSQDESDWVAIARDLPAADLSRLVGRTRGVLRRDETQTEAQRSLTWRWDDDGMLVGQFRLAPEEGTAFISAVQAAHDVRVTQPVDSAGSTETHLPVDAAASTGSTQTESISRIDALVQLVTNPAPAGDDPFVPAHQPEVVLHVSVGDLDAEQPIRRHLDNDRPVGPGTARRLACDPILTALLHDPDGRVIDVGRRHRLVTKPLRRAVYERDNHHCTFPGCPNRRWLDVHHIQHWEDGGATDLDNLLLLCSTHHRAHHTGGFELTMHNGQPTFETADGQLIQPAPTMRAVPAPGRDLLHTTDEGLGPVEGTWDGTPLTRWATDTVIIATTQQQRKQQALSA